MRVSDLHKRILAQSQIDVDAQAFLTATGITDAIITNAINTLVKGLKSNGLWTKMKAIYPFVGGTAITHKFNLKDPRDLDVAFRLQFFGGWIHSTTGAKPNGIDTHANTFLSPFNSLINNNYHLSHYSRTQKITGNEVDLACVSIGPFRMIGIDHYYAGSPYFKAFLAGDFTTHFIGVNNTNTLGFLIGSRTSQTVAKLFFNNIQQGNTLIISNPLTLPNINLFLSANNNGSAIERSSKECAFSSIGDGLSDSEISQYNTLVQAFQTTLGRQV